MKERLSITICLAIITTCLICYGWFWHMSRKTQEISILNNNDSDYTVAYYSSINGSWVKGKTVLDSHHRNKATIRNQNLLKPAHYQVVIGNSRLGKSYCTADIEQPGLGRSAKFTSHHGRCNTRTYANGGLSLIVS